MSDLEERLKIVRQHLEASEKKPPLGTGERFKKLSKSEAVAEIADTLARVRETFGPVLSEAEDPPWGGSIDDWEAWFLQSDLCAEDDFEDEDDKLEHLDDDEYFAAISEDAPKEPVERALKRMSDAFDRGGFKKMVRATEIRIQATKEPGKRAGIVAAIGKHLADPKYSKEEKAELAKLLKMAAMQIERDAGQAFVPYVGIAELTDKQREKLVGKAQKKAKKGVTVPTHYLKECSMKAFRANVEYFYRVKSADWEKASDKPLEKKDKLRRALAASYSTLKRACGVSGSERMTPSEIVKAGGGE